MTTISGTFSAPGVTASLSCGETVTLTVDGEFTRAVINAEFSSDGTTWTKSPHAHDLGINGASKALFDGFGMPPIRAPGTSTIPAVGTMVRLNCVEWNSGWCSWTITA